MSLCKVWKCTITHPYHYHTQEELPSPGGTNAQILQGSSEGEELLTSEPKRSSIWGSINNHPLLQNSETEEQEVLKKKHPETEIQSGLLIFIILILISSFVVICSFGSFGWGGHMGGCFHFSWRTVVWFHSERWRLRLTTSPCPPTAEHSPSRVAAGS